MSNTGHVQLEITRLRSSLISRDAKIVDLCRGKSVLHLGCADYPYSIAQVENGSLLHGKLAKVSARIVGIDLSREGVEHLRSKGYDDVVVGNAEDSAFMASLGTFDVVVAGEIVEHLSNVGAFFRAVSRVMAASSLLIVSVPNAYSLKGMIRAFMGRELVHEDHLYYFSPMTITHLCHRYGFSVLSYAHYLAEPSRLLARLLFFPLKFIISMVSPYVADGLVIVIRKAN